VAAQLQVEFIKRAEISPRGPVVFAVMRNEHYFMPFFFDHYRRLGVDGFLIYDDRSDEAALEFLLRQPDCAVIRSPARFGDVFGQTYWRTPQRLPTALKVSVPEQLLAGRWVLTVDADEFLILPSGASTLADLTRVLAAMDQPYVTAPMVDFYGETLGHRNYPASVDPFEANPYFDVGPYYHWEGRLAPTELLGGVRWRLLQRLMALKPERVSQIYGGQPSATRLWKAPLLKLGGGVRWLTDHELDTPPRTELTCALAHFKFYPGLDAKIADALARRQYVHRSQEYEFLAAAIETLAAESLIGPPTRRYEGPQSLERADLIRRPADWPRVAEKGR
jgi:hypothetical protein